MPPYLLAVEEEAWENCWNSSSTDGSLMTHVAGAGPVFLARSADQLGSPLWHASAMRQQLGHDPARCVHTGVC